MIRRAQPYHRTERCDRTISGAGQAISAKTIFTSIKK
jgi:hypothetical protein